MATDPFSQSSSGNPIDLGLDSGNISDPFASPRASDPGALMINAVKPEDSLAGLKAAASAQGYELNKERSGLETLSRTLNFFPAHISGAIAGLMSPKQSFGTEYNKYTDNNLGFTDLYKELLGAPKDASGKVALTITGFASDVLFDPITYLSFGVSAGAKLGKAISIGERSLVVEIGADGIERMVTKVTPKDFYFTSQGRALQAAAEEQRFSIVDALKAEGIAGDKAIGQATYMAKRDMQELLDGAIKKSGGLDTAAVDRFVAKGFERNTVEEIAQLGPKLLDQGGIKFFGNTLVTSKVLAETTIGKAAKAILESDGISALTKRIKDTIGETFVWAYGKNPIVANAVFKAGVLSGIDAKTYVTSIDKILEKVPLQDREKLFKAVYDRRQEVVKMTKATENKMMEQIRMTGATGEHIAGELAKGEHPLVLRGILESLQGKVISKLALKLENIAKSHADMSWEGTGLQQILDVKKKELATARELFHEEFDKFAKELNSSRAVEGRVISEEEYSATVKYLDSLKKQITQESIVNTQGKIDELLAAIDKGVIPEGTAKAGAKATKEQTQNFVEKAAVLRAQLLEETNKFKALDDSLTKFSDARRVAKAELKKSKIEFLPKKGLPIAQREFLKNLTPDEERLHAMDEAANALFYDERAVTKQMAQDAGIPEADMYAEYIRNAYDNGSQVRTFANGTIGSLGGKGLNKAIKDISYEDAVKRGLITDPLPVLKQTANQIVILKAKKSTINALTQSVGRPLSTFADEAMAKSHGFEKFTRIDPVTHETIGGYFPKELMPDIEGYWNPKKSALMDFTEKFGLQWGTRLFKSAATSIWPAFHMLNLTSNELQNMVSLGVDAFNPRYQRLSALMAGLSSSNPIVEQAARKALAGEVLTTKSGQKISALKLFKQIHGAAPELFQTGQLSKAEMGTAQAPDMLSKIASGKYNPLNPDNAAFAGGQRFGGLVESKAKLMHMIATFEAGGDIKQGVKSAESAIFNYGKLSQFEREVMKQVVPFYTYGRKNLEFQINMLRHNPGRSSMQLKLFNSMNASLSNLHEQDGETGLPLYMRDSLGVHLGNVGTGEHAYIQGIGLPIEDFARRLSGDQGFFWNAVKSVMTQANPLIKYPIEEITGVDIFKGKPIKELTDAQGFADMFKNMPAIPRKQLEELIDFREIPNQPVYKNGVIAGYTTKYYANPYAMHLLANMPYARAVRSAEVLSAPGSKVAPVLAQTTGIKITMVDMEKQKYFTALNQYNELADWLDKIGVLGKYTKYYTPQTPEQKQQKELFK